MGNTRTHKISYGYRRKKRRPLIRLCGDWIEQMGFKIGDTVIITIQQNAIAIAKDLPGEADLGSAGEQPNRNSR